MEYGLELDDVTTEKAIIRKEKHLDGVEDESTEDEEVIYKIEILANRYDLLCIEGLVRALRIFLGLDEIPTYTLSNTPKESMLKMHVKKETVISSNRTYAVAIGTHDLDTLQGPFTYEALSPEEINSVPLKQDNSFRADELMKFYSSDMKLKKFLHIIEDSPVYPVIYDSNRTVLSLPPIINGARSTITLRTKNVFIECTATDLTKAKIVLNTMVSMFSVYCERKFEVEPVEVICANGESCVFPDLSSFDMEVPLTKITGRIGVSLDASQSVPPTRSDVLEACDVAEDVAVTCGFNNIPRTQAVLSTQGRQQPLSQLSYLIRLEIVAAGFTEGSSDFEATRTSVMSGLLKTVRENNHHPKPIKIFEMGDIVLLDDTKDVGAKNSRKVAALYCNESSGYEEISGLVQRIMQIVDIPWIEDPQAGDYTGYFTAASKETDGRHSRYHASEGPEQFQLQLPMLIHGNVRRVFLIASNTMARNLAGSTTRIKHWAPLD
ncbi:hypothetical protein MKX01_002091 [Papaver californicum]|nr:hypothetical protein MKX01_002091 [Papaver californicum]